MSILPHWFIPSLLPLHLVRTSNSDTRVSRTLLFNNSRSSHKGNSPQQSADAGGEKKKLHHGKKDKGKSQDHAHIASAAFFPTMIADTSAAVNSYLYAHQSPQLYQGQGGPAFDSRIKEAFSLTDRLGVTPSCKTIRTLDAHISAPIGETTLLLMDDGHDLEPFDYPPADPPPIPSLDTVMADVSSTTAYLVELSTDEEEPAQAPSTKRKRTCGSCGSHNCTIEPPPTDHWSESNNEFIDIYGSVDGDIAQAAGLDNGWPCMIRSAPSASIAPQCSHSALSAYMHDG